jgi:hypothetical protein
LAKGELGRVRNPSGLGCGSLSSNSRLVIISSLVSELDIVTARSLTTLLQPEVHLATGPMRRMRERAGAADAGRVTSCSAHKSQHTVSLRNNPLVCLRFSSRDVGGNR